MLNGTPYILRTSTGISKPRHEILGLAVAGTVEAVGNDVSKSAAQALVVSPFVSQNLRPFSASGKSDDLAALTGLIEAGKVRRVIDRAYPLSEAGEALAYYGQVHTRGKVVIIV